MRPRRRFVALAVATSLGPVAPAWAQAPAARSLRWDPGVDLAVTLGGAAAWITSELLKDQLAPRHCRWCETDALDASARRALVWHDTATAEQLSNLTGFVVVPLAAIGLDAVAAAHENALGGTPEDVLLVAEAGVLAADVNQLAKLLVGRERPFLHALAPDDKLLTPHPSDNNVSFFSGHTCETFALATASGTVGELRGYRWAPLAWAVGGAFALATAYFRVAADKHWLTDVIVGAVVGAGIGFAVPYLFPPATDDTPRATASTPLRLPPPPAGPALGFAW